MEMLDESKVSGNDHLLSQILSVLNRIDGHLQSQQTAIEDMNSKINAVAPTTGEGVSATLNSEASVERHLKVATALQPFKERRSSTFPTSPSTKLRGPGTGSSARNDSVQSTSTRS